MNINSVLSLLEQNGFGIVLLFMVGYIIINQRLQFKALNGRLDKHEQQCDKWRDKMSDTIDKIKDKVTRIEVEIGLEKRLSEIEKKQPAA